MPNGQVHATATLLGAVIIPASMAVYRLPTSEVVACAIGFIITLSVNPDLDLNRRIPWRHPDKLIWFLVWRPYAWAMPHRSPLSHFPVFGTFFRIFYIGVILVWLAYLLGISATINPLLYWVVIGMIVSDTIHFLLDTVTTSLKRAL